MNKKDILITVLLIIIVLLIILLFIAILSIPFLLYEVFFTCIHDIIKEKLLQAIDMEGEDTGYNFIIRRI